MTGMTLESIAGDEPCCPSTLHQGILVAMVGGGTIGPDHRAWSTHCNLASTQNDTHKGLFSKAFCTL